MRLADVPHVHPDGYASVTGADMDPAVAIEAIIARRNHARNNQQLLENLGRYS